MDIRELLILLLGLAIVGVILRGLYVAIQGRRGQLRLAIEKNIPEVDLDALELAELPRGGARVRSREDSDVEQSVIDAADARAQELDLGTEDQDQEIPVLMDAVEVAEMSVDTGDDTDSQESADDILLDYPEQPLRNSRDNLSSVMPDYDEEEPLAAEDYPDEEDSGMDSVEDPDLAEPIQDASGRREPSLDPQSFEEQLDAFSMTAGERIGDSARSSLDGGEEQSAESAVPTPRSKRNFFSVLRDRVQPKAKPMQHEESAIDETDPEELALAVNHDNVTHLDESREVFAEEMGPATSPAEVLVINVMAPQGQSFNGNDLLHVLISSGLKFGDMNIFHQRLGPDAQAPVIFSVANMINPGSFDLNKMEEFNSPGISMFLALPTAINNLDALERMLKTARQVAAALGGELKDDHRNGMTAQTIEHYRQRVRDFELRRLKSAASRA